MERFYIEQRPGMALLRDRDVDGDPPEWGIDAPGVLASVTARVGVDGSVSIDLHNLERLRADLNNGTLSTEWAERRHATTAEARQKEAKRRADDERQKARDAWADKFRLDIEAVMLKFESMVSHSWCDYTLSIGVGPSVSDERHGARPAADVSVNYRTGTIAWSYEGNGAETLRALVAYAPQLDDLLSRLEAVCAEHMARRPP